MDKVQLGLKPYGLHDGKPRLPGWHQTATSRKIRFPPDMKLLAGITAWWNGAAGPAHLRYGKLGERAAKAHLKRHGLKFLAANFRSERGEIDLVFRERDCLVFVEVKTRSSEEWGRPAAAIDAERRRRLTRAGLDYLALLRRPAVKVRFDIVEVLLADGAVKEIRHLPNAFPMERPYRYG
jgi:putative endonuclease